MRRPVALALCLALALLAAPPAPGGAVAGPAVGAAPLANIVTDLGRAGDTMSAATGINNVGQVVGYYRAEDGYYHGFHYREGLRGTLPTFGGPEGDATGINDDGWIVGSAYTADYEPHAYLYRPGSMRDLNPYGGRSYANAINAAGQVTGSGGYPPPNTASHGFRWREDGGATRLFPAVPVTDGDGWPNAINASGQIVGDIWFEGNTSAFLWRGGVVTYPYPDAQLSTATGINDTGQVVGYGRATYQSPMRAFLWRDGASTDLGTLGDGSSQAYAINAAGRVVGRSDAGNGEVHAFLWTPTSANGATGAMVDLNGLLPPGSGWLLTEARGINDRGQIVGQGVKGGERHAFLLTLDADGDGLLDAWEEGGLTIDPDGDGPIISKFIDLPAMGADPNKPDIFLHLDWMQDATHDQRLSNAAIKIVVDAFRDSPYRSPTGSVGINLHVDQGPGSILDFGTNATWGPLSRARALPWVALLGTMVGFDYNWGAFQAIKDEAGGFTESGRAPAFHYVIVAANFSPSYFSGISRGIGASDLIVASDGATVKEQAGSLMHELGHNLGLEHGGGDSVNYKPNYLSVMNYAHSQEGIIRNGVAAFDYSRRDLGPLDETRLDEPAGLGPAAAGYGTRHWCAAEGQFRVVLAADGPINWDCAGAATRTGFPQDTNNDGVKTPPLAGYNDWANLRLIGGAIGQFGAIPPLPLTTAADELTPEDAARSQPLHTLALAATPGGSAAADAGPGYPGGDTATLTATPNAGYTFVGWTVDGAAAGGANPLALAMDADHTVRAIFAPVAPPATVALTVVVQGGGAVGPGSGGYPPGTLVALTPQPGAGQTFVGWAVDGANAGWATPLTLTMDAAHTVTASFAPTKAFADVGGGREDYAAIVALAARGSIRGYQNGNYGPDDGVQRAQMAALIARVMPAGPGAPPTALVPPACLVAGSWDCEDWGNAFTDRNGLEGNLWRNAGALQHYQVARGYTAADCAAKGRAFPCYGPTDPVTHAETIAFITRAMQAKGYWTAQPGAAQPYAGVPAVFAGELATFHFYTQGRGGVPARPANWNAQATRGWFARALWAALDAYWGTDRVP